MMGARGRGRGLLGRLVVMALPVLLVACAARKQTPPAERAEQQSPLPFDLAAIRDATTARCQFTDPREVTVNGVALTVWRLSYLSWEWRDGALQPIRIRAFAARPRSASGRLAGVVQAHGLGSFADTNSAAYLAARLGMFTVAYSGPGLGPDPANTSEGRPSTDGYGYQLFDTLRDVRGSWFWAHTTAALRGLTCLAARPDVDGERLGMTGFSAGGIATLISAAVDDRVKAAVPLSSALSLNEAVRSEAAWEHSLLSQCRLTTRSPEWQILNRELLEPALARGGGSAKVFLINGTTDEFFPLTAHVQTLRSFGGPDTRTSLIGNFDHGCYKTAASESPVVIERRARIHNEGGQLVWFRHYLLGDAAYAVIPRAPVVTTQAAGTLTRVRALVDQPRGVTVESVTLWWSGDHSYSYGSLPMEHQTAERYETLAALPLTATSIYFVDVQYRTNHWLVQQHFAISSEPVIAAGLIPHIRALDNCR